MFQSWRFKIRQCDEALKAGRLDEACEMLSNQDLAQYLPGRRLATSLAAQLVSRARQHVRGQEFASAWTDLEKAAALSGETRDVLTVRQWLIDCGFEAVEQRLHSGDISAAQSLVDTLTNKAPRAPLETLREVTRRVQSALNLSRRGRFADSESQWSAAMDLRPDLSFLEDRQRSCREKLRQARPLREQLHQSLAASDWTRTVSLAEQLLELAPECRLAQDARRRAWAHVDPRFASSGPTEVTVPWKRSGSSANRDDDERLSCGPGTRFVLWIDGVGGYLVCLADEIVLGQSAPANQVDVPILGDLSRRHARLYREGGGYSIEPLHHTSVNGRRIEGRTLLADGDEIELGAGVRLKFRQPHVLSASAKLEFLSKHRTQPSADGILLMAESCVLGPKWQNHVVCRDWSGDVVLYRQEDDLFCRAMDAIEIDGALCDGRGRVGRQSHVVGEDFSLSLEELDKCSAQPLL